MSKTTTTSQLNYRSINSDDDDETHDLILIQSCQYHRDQVIRYMMTAIPTTTATVGINGVRDQSHLAPFHFDQYLHYYDRIQQQKQQKQSDAIQHYDHSNLMTDDSDTIQHHQSLLLLLLPRTTYEQLIDMYLHRFHNPIRAANVWHHITMNHFQQQHQQQQQQQLSDGDIMSQWINNLKDRIEQYTNHRYASVHDMHDGHALWYRPQLMNMAQYHHHHHYYDSEQLLQSDTHTLCADDSHDSVDGAATMTMTNRLKCKIEQVFDCIWQEQQRYNNTCDHHTLRMKFEESNTSLTSSSSSSSLSHRSIYTDAHIENRCVFYREKPLVYVDLNHLSSSQDTSLKRLKRQVFHQFISIGDGTTRGKQGKVKHKKKHKNRKKRHVTDNGEDNDDIAEDNKNKIVIRFVFLIMKLLMQSLMSHRTGISASSGGSTASGNNGHHHHHSIYDTYPLLSILEPSIIYRQQQMGSSGDESDDGGQLEDMHTINELYRLMMSQLQLPSQNNIDGDNNDDTMAMDLGTFERLYLTMSNYCFGSVSTEQYFMGQIISLVNHSCAPNAKLVLVHNSDDNSDDDPELTLVALRDIQPGEQITISYFGPQLSMDSESHSDGRSGDTHGRNIRQERRKSMAYHHGFTCAETCHCDPEVKQRMLLL